MKKLYKRSKPRTPVSRRASDGVICGPLGVGDSRVDRCHGTLVSVLGVGVLLRGMSGIGKSECALELIRRGFFLVADDLVLLELGEEGGLVGRSPDCIRGHLEIRGVGIVNISELYGSEAVLDHHSVDLVCDLESWEAGKVYDRVGVDRERVALIDVEVPQLLLPIRALDSLATIVELAARDHLQRRHGKSAAERLDARIGVVRST